jgi:hypothetical protein
LPWNFGSSGTAQWAAGCSYYVSRETSFDIERS